MKKNYGTSVIYDFADVFNKEATLYLSVGSYKNNLYENAAYAGLGIKTFKSKLLGEGTDFGAEVLLTHGYRLDDGKKPNIVAIPHIFVDKYTVDDITFRVGLIPLSLADSLGLIDNSNKVDIVTFGAVLKF